MNKRNELTERDRNLLEKIEVIVSNGGDERREADSLYGFCAQLSSAVPQAYQSFQQQLEARLVAEMQQQREVRALGVTAQVKGGARPPLSWLQRLAQGVGHINQIFERGVTMKKRFALAAIAALVIVLSTVAFVPSVQAQVMGWFRARWEVPGMGMEIAGTQPGFTVLVPSYLPDVSGSASQMVGMVTAGDDASMSNFFGDPDGQWLQIIQGPAPADKSLPEGQEVIIGVQKGVLIAGLSGTIEFGLADLENVAVEGMLSEHRPESFAYQNANQLVWYVGDTRIELLSNLSVEEMLKVAESFQPAEVTEGEPPADWVPEPEQSEGEGGSSGGVMP